MSVNTHSAEGLDVVQELSPSQCRPWKYHNRSGGTLLPECLASLAESIESDGQQQAGMVRVLDGADGFQYEVIFGMRRCSACESIGKSFLAKVLPATTPDQVCARLMHIENEERADISDIERAKNYRSLLLGGVFGSQLELATELCVTPASVSQTVKAAEIFDYAWLTSIVEPELTAISLRTALKLARALSKPDRQRLMRDRARRLVDQAREQKHTLVVSDAIRILLESVGVDDKATVKREVLVRVGRRPVVEFLRTKGGGVQLSIEKIELPSDKAEELIGEIAERVRSFVSVGRDAEAKA